MRFLCWDKDNIKYSDNVTVRMHKPQKKNIALVCDEEWEGAHNGYAGLVKSGDVLRMYYRADSSYFTKDGMASRGGAVICMAESHDGGITFSRPVIGKYEFNGSKFNNIVFAREEKIDNFSVFYDENPACPKDERFKALARDDADNPKLRYYASADGIDFREMRALPIEGRFDSYNTALWNEREGLYYLYFRGFHSPDGCDRLDLAKGIDFINDIRDIRVATSRDFVNWETHGRIKFTPGQSAMPLYTNQITRYYREPGTLIGFPMRYLDRAPLERNFNKMPMYDRRKIITKNHGRTGTSVTDCVIMTSQDGFEFNRRDEAYLTPGIETRNNWWYGNCMTASGITETDADEYGAPREISFYAGENYRVKNVNFRRYTVRLDGFFSYEADFSGGVVMTKEITVTGDKMELNFSTSALGGITVALCRPDGEPIEGYESYEIFGDSVDREVEFERPLSALCGQEVCVRFEMKDADIYSFSFE